MTKVLTEARSIRLKGRSFLAVVLSPDLPIDQWLAQLDDLAARSAGFFLEKPIVLDVSDIAIDRATLKQLLAELSTRNVKVMGIEGARPSLFDHEMPPAMKGGRSASDFEVPIREQAEATPKVEVQPTTVAAPAVEQHTIPQSMVIREPVRSGQTIMFPEGDVTVIGSVSSGAEIIAGGSVHIYGTLRGRVLAGSLGNGSARVFCRKLEAELVSIDGVYTTADEMESGLRGQAVQIWLDGDAIRAQKLI